MYPEEDNRNITSSANTASGSYSAILPSPNIDITNSINSSLIPLPLSEDLLAGQRLNGRMSSVRRFFCLFVTFDLLFTSLMWLICVMLNGESIWIAIDKEIYHYNIHTSLFDITLAAICRFTVLLLFYGLCHINHWLIISLSTAGTCAFLISKVFVFNWQDSPQPVFQVLLILTSFVLAWGEAWFLDFRVIPQEIRANQFFFSTTTPDSERTPLIRSYVQGLPSTYAYTNTESIANFYSPQGSPSGSIHRFGEQSSRSTTHLTQDQVDFYKNLATKTVIDAAELVRDDDWKVLKQNEDDDVVSVLGLSNANRKIYKLTALVKVRARYLLEELFDRVEQMPNWNPALAESNRLDVIDDRTDITYQISATAARGVIASRDFLNLRCWQMREGRYIIGNVGIEDHHLMPETEKYTRGRNGIGCWAIDPIESNPEQCYLEWIVNTDLKLKLNGWLTGPFLEKAYVNLLFDFARDLRTHLKKCDERL